MRIEYSQQLNCTALVVLYMFHYQLYRSLLILPFCLLLLDVERL